MTLSNWIELAAGLVILIAGISSLVHFRLKFRRMDGFEGVISERGQTPRRAGPGWGEELKHLEDVVKK